MSHISDILKEFGKDHTIKRADGPTIRIRGTAQPVTRNDVIVFSVVLPATGKDVVVLEEGKRTRETIKIITESELLAPNNETKTPADTILYKGDIFELAHVAFIDTNKLDMDYYKGLAQRKLN